jgi:hypothetical protein
MINQINEFDYVVVFDMAFSLYGNRTGSREFGLIQNGRTRLRSGQFALIVLTFKQFSELYFMLKVIKMYI